jgi:hypothetical protein
MIYLAVVVFLIVVVAATIAGLRLARRKNIDIIVRAGAKRKRQRHDGAQHLFFCFVDHYEPLWKGADRDTGIERVKLWRERYPKLVDGFRDNGGRPPQHVFFYPQEEYVPECLDMLAELENRGYGEVEIHLHHDNDTSEGFREKIEWFRETLHNEHGLLRLDPDTGELTYAFIHGNWALDDSGEDGRWCGVRDEISLLRQTGCYADFTYPSAPHCSQPPIINRIYYATDVPGQACSHHNGVDARFGTPPSGDLLLINGPLALNWRRRKYGVLPAVENGDITGINPGTPDRVDRWVRTAVSVRDWPSWIFVKIHTHGTIERNSNLLLSPAGSEMYADLLARYNDGEHYILHFVTAWQMYRCVRALERGDRDSTRRIEEFDYTFAPIRPGGEGGASSLHTP